MKEILEEWVDGKEAEVNQWGEVNVVLFDGHRGMVVIGQENAEVVELDGEVDHQAKIEARSGLFEEVDKSIISAISGVSVKDDTLIVEGKPRKDIVERLYISD